MNFEEKQLKSKTLYDGKILKLNVDEVSLPDGSLSVREYVRHSGGAGVLLIKDESVLLVKQFRYVYGKEIYEIPAGKVNRGEDGRETASRELEEETGYRAELVHYFDEIIRIYRAVSCEFVGQKLDEGEFLKCEFIPLNKVKEMIDDGTICDAKTVSAVYRYLSEKA